MRFQHRIACGFPFIVFFPNWKQTLRIFLRSISVSLLWPEQLPFAPCSFPVPLLMLRRKQHARVETFISPVPVLQTGLRGTKDIWHFMTASDLFLSLSLSSKVTWPDEAWSLWKRRKLKCKQSWIMKWCHSEPIGTVGIMCLAATSNAHKTIVLA